MAKTQINLSITVALRIGKDRPRIQPDIGESKCALAQDDLSILCTHVFIRFFPCISLVVFIPLLIRSVKWMAYWLRFGNMVCYEQNQTVMEANQSNYFSTISTNLHLCILRARDWKIAWHFNWLLALGNAQWNYSLETACQCGCILSVNVLVFKTSATQN